MYSAGSFAGEAHLIPPGKHTGGRVPESYAGHNLPGFRSGLFRDRQLRYRIRQQRRSGPVRPGRLPALHVLFLPVPSLYGQGQVIIDYLLGNSTKELEARTPAVCRMRQYCEKYGLHVQYCSRIFTLPRTALVSSWTSPAGDSKRRRNSELIPV